MKPVTHRQIQVYDRKVSCTLGFLSALDLYTRQLRDFLEELPETFRLPYDGNEVLLPADQNAIGHLRLLMINIGSHNVLLPLYKLSLNCLQPYSKRFCAYIDRFSFVAMWISHMKTLGILASRRLKSVAGTTTESTS